MRRTHPRTRKVTDISATSQPDNEQRRTPVIGIAGAIAAGKSTVTRLLQSLGCAVSDSDQLARDAFKDPEIVRTLVDWWSENILADDGTINRAAVAAIVFKDPEERRRLEGITHPWIARARDDQFRRAAADPAVIALVIDAPLLFEAGVDAECDATIFVDAPWDIRLARVVEHRNWTEEELLRREDSQMPLDEKRQKADYVIQNAGSEDDLANRVREVLEAIRHNAGQSQEPPSSK